jgi:apolipoprotein N-acyltransferase
MLAALFRAGSLGIDLAKGRARAQARHVMRQAAVGAATLLFLILAFSFGLAAFTVWLSRMIGAIPALGFIGFAFLVIAALIVAIAAMTDKQRRRTRPEPIAEAVKHEFASAATEPVPPGSTVAAMGVVALIGYLFARQLYRR